MGPVNATIPLIVDFLVHLRCGKGLSVSVVKGYLLALNSVFALKSMDMADSREISVLPHEKPDFRRICWRVATRDGKILAAPVSMVIPR